MSDDEYRNAESIDIDDDDDDDEPYFVDDEEDDDDDEPVITSSTSGARAGGPTGAASSASSSTRRRQPSPPPLAQLLRSQQGGNGFPSLFNPSGVGGGGMGGGSGAFPGMGGGAAAGGLGYGGHAFARPPAGAFRRQYKAYSTATLEAMQGRSNLSTRDNIMYGGKMIMPPSALDEIMQLDLELPMDFELRNPKEPELVTHAGVVEFIAEEGCVHLPAWMMAHLQLQEGDTIRLWGKRLPKGTLAKLQPQSTDFLELSDPKAVLEAALRHYSCLTEGDVIEISYNMCPFGLKITEVVPKDAGGGISILDTDLPVDFEAPVGYKEPEYTKPSLPSLKDKLKIDTSRKDEVDARGSGTSTPRGGAGSGAEAGGSGEESKPSWEAFKGSGQSIGGKRIRGKGIKAKKAEEVDATSRIARTDKPRFMTADTQVGGREVPAALNVPFGTLFFGFEEAGPAPGSEAEREAMAKEQEAQQQARMPFAGVQGSGNTLSGRRREASARGGTTSSRASSAAPSPSSAPSGGHTLGGGGSSTSGGAAMDKQAYLDKMAVLKKKKPTDAIVIDD